MLHTQAPIFDVESWLHACAVGLVDCGLPVRDFFLIYGERLPSLWGMVIQVEGAFGRESACQTPVF